ncbi:MAG: cytochrome b/b6 domain-containing protein [Aestuariibacter sp.]
MHKSLIWDIYTRIFHWLLVVCIGLQWLTGELGGSWMNWHAYVGYFTLGLILFRLIWGLVGADYARFKRFFPGFDDIKQCVRGENRTYLSHNPLGAVMVFALLLIILIQAISGLFSSDDVFFDGPLRSLANEQWQQLADKIHHNGFTVIQILAAVHIIAAFYYLFGKKQNLISPLFHGYKNTEQDRSIKHQYHWRALLIALLVAAAIYFLVTVLPPEVVEEVYF